MSYGRMADPLDDFHAYDAHQQSELDRLPRCSECGEPIQTDECYEINDELICPECLDQNHRKWVDDYVE